MNENSGHIDELRAKLNRLNETYHYIHGQNERLGRGLPTYLTTEEKGWLDEIIEKMRAIEDAILHSNREKEFDIKPIKVVRLKCLTRKSA